jgi:glycosyltransferase involved in cell wall biosynthesis
MEVTTYENASGVDVTNSAPDAVAISVIVPVYNEEPRLEENLRTLLAQHDAPSFEIVYIDDCSTDRSWEMLLSFSVRDSRIRVYRLEQWQSRGAVGRFGVSCARGNVVAIMGADCTAEPDWLSNVRFLTGDIAVLGFPVLPPPDVEYLHWKFQFAGSGQVPDGNMPHGAGALIRRDLLLKAGNFPDARVGADVKAFRAMKDLGGRILLMQGPPVHLLQKRTTIRDHLRRYFERGRNAGSRSRRLYFLMMTWLVALLISSVLLWNASPLLSVLAFFAAFGPLVNPGRVRYYVRAFRKPRNVVARAIVFSAVKALESVSLLLGYIASFGHGRPS